ncbi:MAG: ATP-binding cassette domain-containing protein, partial [Chitinivibrionales bacterium]|nr:ATP-binding cassette domain-containing protein [Chitinivibrionales bacterium]
MEEMLRLEGIERIYKTGKAKVHALKNVTIAITSGEFVSIAGPSGSGKSTLLNILGCLDSPDEGKVFFNDRDVHRLNDDEQSEFRNREIGFIFQSFNLIPVLNVYENIELPLVFRPGAIDKNKVSAKIHDLIEKVGLKDEIAHRPNELSGGQQQRV